MLTLIGDSTVEVKNPKIANLETVDTGVVVNTTRQGSVAVVSIVPKLTKKRFDFQWLTLAKKEELLNFLILHIGRLVTIQWSSGDSCNANTINGSYLVDDQPLEVIDVHDGCSYDVATYWIEVQSYTSATDNRITELSNRRITESGGQRVLETA